MAAHFLHETFKIFIINCEMQRRYLNGACREMASNRVYIAQARREMNNEIIADAISRSILRPAGLWQSSLLANHREKSHQYITPG